jgi:membrane fusion protein (multidrug efflux system)
MTMTLLRKRHSILLAAALLFSACSDPAPPPAPPPPAVEVKAVTMEPVATQFEFVARTRASEDTEIRARITGNIVERNFAEGQVVQEGDLLYRIDPRPYRAALNVANAELSQARAAVDVAQRNLKRGEELAPNGYISDAEMDKLRGEYDGALASREAAEAAVERASIDLDFTDIRAPFTGTAGRSQLSKGDLVDPTAGALVTLVQLDPMLTDFDIDEQALAENMKRNQNRIAQGLDPLVYTPRLKLVTGDEYAQAGEIDYASNRINPSTGTVTVTAKFPNPDGMLIPGQFVRVVLRRGEAEMRLMIPQPSVLEDMQGRYVYTVADDDTVVRKNVVLGSRQGINWVVASGLEEGDRVIVNGVQKVRPGIKVVPSTVAAVPHRENAPQ